MNAPEAWATIAAIAGVTIIVCVLADLLLGGDK